MTLFTPYINSMAAANRFDKLSALMRRYYLTEREIVSVIYIRIIFEIINNGYADMLKFIERHKNWIDLAALDLAVSTGEFVVLEYILANSDLRTPTDIAVAQAIYDGCFEVLNVLDRSNYNFSGKGLFLEKACRAAYSKGMQSLEFLLRRGYSLTDGYKGKTVSEHARDDLNFPLTEYLIKHLEQF
jgi:hypothetical protein